MKHHVREFFRVGPARRDHVVATRCAISVGLPLIILLAVGRFDLMIFAACAIMPWRSSSSRRWHS